MTARDRREFWHNDRNRCLDEIREAKTPDEKVKLKRKLKFIDYVSGGKRKEKE